MACALGLAITVALLLRRPERKMVTFRVMELGTETPVTNVSFLIRRRWTTLPLQKVGLPANWAWRKRVRTSGYWADAISVGSRLLLHEMH